MEFRDLQKLPPIGLARIWHTIKYVGLGDWSLECEGNTIYFDSEDKAELDNTLAHGYIDAYNEGLINDPARTIRS